MLSSPQLKRVCSQNDGMAGPTLLLGPEKGNAAIKDRQEEDEVTAER